MGSSGITKQGHLAFDSTHVWLKQMSWCTEFSSYALPGFAEQRALDYDQDGSWNPFRESQKGRLPVLRYTGYLYMTVSERLGPLLVTNALEDKDLLVFYRILGGPLLVLIEHSIPVGVLQGRRHPSCRLSVASLLSSHLQRYMPPVLA